MEIPMTQSFIMSPDYLNEDEIAYHERQFDNLQLADELRRLIDRPRKGESLPERLRHEAREDELQEILKHRFGEQHGWKLSPAAFTLKCLARGGRHDGNGYDPTFGYLHDAFDHPFYYRLNRRAVAIATHLYNWPTNETACRQIAQAYGLDVCEDISFPSWWYPAATKLVLWTGAIERKRRDDELAWLAHGVCAFDLASS
jgi:hypothetical protein